jgi:hypothetical protein
MSILREQNLGTKIKEKNLLYIPVSKKESKLTNEKKIQKTKKIAQAKKTYYQQNC